MKKILLTILVSTLFTTNSFAKSEAGGDCPEGCKNKIEGMPVGDGSSIDQFVKVAEKLPSTEFPPMFLKMVCSFANNTKYESMIRTIERKGYKLEDIYLDLDCSKVGLTGPTLMHLLLQGESILIHTAIKLANGLKDAKRLNSNLNTGDFFNMKTSYASSSLTVLGILDWRIENAKRNNINADDLNELRDLLIKDLDASLESRKLQVASSKN